MPSALACLLLVKFQLFVRPSGAIGSVSATPDEHLYALARAFTASRRRLTTHLDASLFANPGLDIMLFLFAEGQGGRAVTTNACCAAAGVPRTTAVRWINMLIGMGLFHSAPHPTDRRLALLSMSDEAREGMRQWLGGLRPLLERVEAARATPRG